MTHFLLLFIVLFGGFLGWGLWELSEHYYRHAQRRFDRDWANAIRYNRRPWISITAMMEMMRKITERHFFPTEIGVDWAKPHQDSVDAMSFAMNTQQQFIRPKASQFPELDWGLLKAMEERRKLVNCWVEVIIDNQLFNVGFDIPKNVQDEIIIGTYLTPEERAKYFD